MSTQTLTPELVNWAKRTALEVDPDNEDLAPMMLNAYLQGGQNRKQLFERDAVVGSFSSEGILPLLAFAFTALSLIGKELMELQVSGGLDAINGLLSAWKTWLEALKARQSLKEKASTEGKRDEYASLYRILQKVEKSLRKRGLSREQSELLTYQVIKSLLEEPDEGAKIIAEFPSE